MVQILVPIKRVIDAYVKVRVKSDHSDVETQNVKMSMNPFDEIAVEEALRLKEAGLATQVTVVTVGPPEAQDVLRTALALGADDAILVKAEQGLQAQIIAKILKVIVEQQAPQLVIMGKQAIDDDSGQVGPMLAGLLDWPQASFASEVTLATEEVTVICEIDGGLRTLALRLPAVVTTDLRLNEPRYASLPNIMKAKKKPLTEIPVQDLGVTLESPIKITKVCPPAARQAGVMVADVTELVDKLRNEAQVL